MNDVSYERRQGRQAAFYQVGRQRVVVDDLDLKMSPVISETVGSLKLASGELTENGGREFREGVELFEAVSVWWMNSIFGIEDCH